MLARRYLLKGRVQGVGFRYFAYRAAHSLGIQGWVRNLRTGEVEIHAQGSEEAIREFLSQIRCGPSLAVVTDVDIREVEPGSYAHFSIEGEPWRN